MNLNSLTFRGKPVYYGWIIVGGFVLVVMISMGMLGVNFGLFIEPMSREMGVGQVFFGWAQTARLLGSSASGFIIGYILDHYGARWPMAIAGLLVAAAMVAMGMVTAGWQIVAIFMLMGMVGLQGAGGNLYIIVTISNWFVRHRGKAMSRVFLGTPIGILVFAPLTAFLIKSVGWRDAVTILGIIGGAVVVLVALLVRRRPDDMGLPPDGIATAADLAAEPRQDEEKQPQVHAAPAEYSWSRQKALRAPAFWKLSIAFGLVGFAISSTNIFRVPHLVNRGIDPQIVAYSLSFEALIVLAITLPIGYAASRFQLRYILIFSNLVNISVMLLLMVSTEIWQAFLANALFGVGATSQMIVMSIIWPDYFGRGNIGVIRGLTLPVTTALSFAGAPIAGMAYDKYGSYAPGWFIAIFLLLIATVLFFTTPKPSLPADAATTSG